jgi:hypothetical protein
MTQIRTEPIVPFNKREAFWPGLPLRPDPEGEAVEACCFCRKPSLTWTALPERTDGEQVACCVRCAIHARPHHVPTKKEWFERECIAGGQKP